MGLRGSYTEPSSQKVDAKTLLNDANNDGQVAFDDDGSTELPSGAEGEDVNNDGRGDALGDQTTGDNGGGDDDESDDATGDEGQ